MIQPAAPPSAPSWLARLGDRTDARLQQALLTAGFVGQVLGGFARVAGGRSLMRWRDLVHQVDRCGPQSLPIVLLTCGLMGLMLAYMGAAQLERFGAPSMIATAVTLGIVREMAALMLGVILSGRLAASFAAQLGTMVADEEVDALRAMGADVIDLLVMPRVLALLVVAPLLWVFAIVAGVLAGLPVSTGIYNVPPAEYLNRAWTTLTPAMILVGLFKAVLYAVLLGIAGCREGLYAARSTEGVGDATTTAVVKALVWIVVGASVTTIVFQALKW